MKLIDKYFEYVDKYTNEYGKNTIVLMQVGAFFEVYGKKHTSINGIFGSAIQEFANICDLKISQKSKVTIEHVIHDTTKSKTIKCNVLMAGFCDYIIDKYLDKLNDSGFTCIVFKQNENTPSAPRELLGIFSPGTYFQDKSSQLTNYIMCISLLHKKPSRIYNNNKYYYGITCMDVLNGKTNICEYNEQYYSNLTTFDELEKQYSIYQPHEIIFLYNSTNINDNLLDSIIQYIGIQSKVIRKIDTSQENIFSIISKKCESLTIQREILKNYLSLSIEEIEYFIDKMQYTPTALHSYIFLLEYIYKQNQEILKKIKLPSISKQDHLVLANHSLRQLNIINDGNSNGKLSSVASFINVCKTNMGKRYIKEQLVNPSTCIEYLKKSYDSIETVLTNYDLFHTIRNQLDSICDIEKMYRKLVLQKVTPYDITILYDTLVNLSCICNTINNTSIASFHNKNIFTSLENMKEFIDKHINIKVACQENLNFFNRGLFEELDNCEKEYVECFDKIKVIQQWLSDCIKKQENKPKLTDYIKLHETEKSGMTFKTTTARCKKLFTEIQNTCKESGTKIKLEYRSSYNKNTHSTFDVQIDDIHKENRGNDIIIQSGLINKLLHMHIILGDKMKEHVKLYFKQFISSLILYQTDFENIINYTKNLDVVISKAYLAKKYNYCKPIINNSYNESFLNANNIRHILIEHLNINELYVANSVSLGVKNKENGFLLYGTNAVGKSSLIKSLGITVILAQAGFYVPCDSFEFKPFEYIFTRILGNDNIFKGLSTFAVEMSELRTILQLSNKNSLILGDELCSGTELGSAISIFLAGLIELHKRNSKFVFATHFHEVIHMTELKTLNNLSIKHMSVYYDNSLDALVYDRTLKDGPGNNMYGLEVCKALNLPKDFIDLALQIRNNDDKQNKSISESNKSFYNAKKFVNKCEICGNKAIDVHHLQHQKNARNDGFISYTHKNHLGNLMNLCHSCHVNIHKSNKQHLRKKTTKGMYIIEK